MGTDGTFSYIGNSDENTSRLSPDFPLVQCSSAHFCSTKSWNPPSIYHTEADGAKEDACFVTARCPFWDG